jgi:hypothetical protein
LIKDGANVVPFDGFAEPQAAIAKRALRSGFTSICANAPTFESLRSPEPDLDLSTAPVINLNTDDVVSPETQPIRTTCCIFQFSCCGARFHFMIGCSGRQLYLPPMLASHLTYRHFEAPAQRLIRSCPLRKREAPNERIAPRFGVPKQRII